jgi:hypothetical protein
MLIFDSFPSKEQAQAFADACQSRYGRKAQVFDSVNASDEVDPFPFELRPPIVHVERDTLEVEEGIQSLVNQFGGDFAGT